VYGIRRLSTRPSMLLSWINSKPVHNLIFY
jgi:hypothetical protein